MGEFLKSIDWVDLVIDLFRVILFCVISLLEKLLKFRIDI
jgi:hypothetical protein